jgi:hypothetical protein
MARTTVRSVINNLVCGRTYVRRRSALAPRRRVAFTVFTERGAHLNRESLALLPGNDAPGAQLLGEGKWQETLGFTPT